MILKQHYLACLSHASYFLGDEASGLAVVVDPQRDIERYLEDARRHGLTIAHVLLTHFHADFVSGHLELRERCGATIHVGAAGRTDYAVEPMRDGGRLELGKLRLEFLATPGHTPESTCILVYDLARDPHTPHAVLTGDTLFIGDVGRPDLLTAEGVTAEQLAGQLYASLHEKLMPLPDEVLVFPAHGAGSACGKNLSKDTSSPLGLQKRTNWALQPMPREEFIRLLTTDQAPAPAYFAFDADLNRRERRTLESALQEALRPMPLAEVLRRVHAGALVLDVRDPDVYAARHLAGSVNIGLGGRFASWAGTLLPRERELVLLAEPGRESEAALRLGRVGYDRVVGYLQGGPLALEGRDDLCTGHERIEARELARRLEAKGAPRVLDVRTRGEWRDGHIQGSLNIPLDELEQRILEVPRGGPLAVHCQGGYRSSVAASLLERHGVRGLADLRGGIQAWREAGQPEAAPSV